MLFAFFETLGIWVQPWADLYSKHANLSTAVLTVHVLSMFVGGGMAIAADRAILRAPAGSAEATRAVMADLVTTHSYVIGSLVVSFITGISLFLSDVPTFSVSAVYWVKMSALVLLLINGLRMQRAEDRVMGTLRDLPIHTSEMPIAFARNEWSAIRRTAVVSLITWISIVILGMILTNK